MEMSQLIYRILKLRDEDNLIVIPSGWKNHGVSVALYQDKLIITNRGDLGDQNYGSKIYQIPKDKLHLIDADYIESLIRAGSRDSDRFFSLIKKLVDIQDPNVKPIQQFPSKGQKHGTCGFVNHKSSIEAFLYLFKLEELNKLKPDEAQKQAKDYARTHYKELTHQMREQEINQLIETIKKPGQSKAMEKMYIELVEALLKEHHDLPEDAAIPAPYKKVKNYEMERNRRLLEALPTHPEPWLLKIREHAKQDEQLSEALKAYDVYLAKYNRDGSQKLPPLHAYTHEKDVKTMQDLTSSTVPSGNQKLPPMLIYTFRKDSKIIQDLPRQAERPDFHEPIERWKHYIENCKAKHQELTAEQFSALSREVTRLTRDVQGNAKPLSELKALKAFFDAEEEVALHKTRPLSKK
jgi:hypothetical protein